MLWFSNNELRLKYRLDAIKLDVVSAIDYTQRETHNMHAVHAVGGTPIGQSEASDRRRPPRLHDIPVVYAIRPRMSANLRNDRRKKIRKNSKHEIHNDSNKTVS